mmetsp:Transcript_27163/g.69134  ORF Transcript_27163/g.69134 Transcript_27163/m.69134 type:complete len:649 (-) Transcript_27163:2405-4351(-)
MTKHNGKSRKAGIKPGSALMNRVKINVQAGKVIAGQHTTDLHPAKPGIQSVLERNDLEELMAMADMADRDFTAERTQVVVVSTGVVDPLSEQRAAEERAATEERNRHRLKLPRRPPWDETTTPDQLDAQERSRFVVWRRELATIEEGEGLCLTPFEKNLEVWRQLWRVLERSDIMVQVVDARDPLLYRCEDLEAYAHELHATKHSLLLLNKADLLPEAVRRQWADYFEKAGVSYAFWSAYAVQQDQAALKAQAAESGEDWHELREEVARRRRLQRIAEAAARAQQGDGGASGSGQQRSSDDPERVRVLSAEELIELLEEKAREAVAEAGPDDPRAQELDRRVMVGLVGYPNVGKSSTINALFGSKKTAVAPTPGKTKHFQTLNISTSLCLCDCPGLVMPKFARSKAEMVVAGVIPIDRLTDMRAPVEALAQRVGRLQAEEAYGVRLPPPPAHLPAGTPPTAAELLRAFAMLRGWTVGSGLPDEARAGRQLLKDYTSGKLLNCTLPPGSDPPTFIPRVHDPATLKPIAGPQPTAPPPAASPAATAGTSGPSAAQPASTSQGVSVATGQAPLALDEADLDLLMGDLGLDAGSLPLAGGDAKAKPKRAEHKFHKKAARTKGNRGEERAEGIYDGAAMVTGKKGGLVRVAGY